LGHLSAEIRARNDGIDAKTFFRKLHCKWSHVRHVEVRPFMPGLTIYLVSTTVGPVVFTSLWRNHRELLSTLQERVRSASRQGRRSQRLSEASSSVLPSLVNETMPRSVRCSWQPRPR